MVERPINATIFPVDEQVASFRYFFFTACGLLHSWSWYWPQQGAATGKSCKPISRKQKCFQKANKKSLLFNGQRDNAVLLF